MPITTDILINDKSWKKHNPKIKSYLKNLINEIIPNTQLSKALQNNSEIEVSVVLTNDLEIKDLNKTYRNKDKATNVLSFPATNPDSIKDGSFEEEDFLAMGDIIFSFDTIQKESLEQNKEFNKHLTHLLVHSILHLLGYDHEIEREAKIMEDLEVELLKKLAIDNPYIIN